jgi:hypothetical protein
MRKIRKLYGYALAAIAGAAASLLYFGINVGTIVGAALLSIGCYGLLGVIFGPDRFQK